MAPSSVPTAVATTLPSPLPTDDPAQAPVILRNQPLAEPFETIVDLYGRPVYGGFDPTPILAFFFATFFGGSMLLMPIFADQILGVGKQGLGLLYAAQPVGAAIAGAFMAAVALPKKQGVVILWSVAFYGVAIAVFGASRWFWLSLLALAASGAADTVSMVIRQTVRQLVTPDDLAEELASRFK